MKRILLSLMTVATVSIVGVVATRAFFSDVETSTGNTFTAGQVDLQIDYDGYYNRAPTPTPDVHWDLKDLVSEKFFDFADIKPGDYGEGTVSIHVVNNDAWACLTISNLQNNDNTCPDPEKEAEGGTTCGTDPGAGELAQNLYFTAWADNGNNIWEAGEQLLFTNKYGPASDVLSGRTYALADSTIPGGPILKGTTRHIGIQWCAGTMTIDEIGNIISCDGSGMGNDTQTDSLTADIEFYVEQARNNPNFRCVPTATPTP